jgi:hypothetical protein
MKPKPECCKKYDRKAKACKRCPLMLGLSKKGRRKRLRALKK